MRFFYTIIILVPLTTLAQVGGENGYRALNLVTNARTAALGGTSISFADGDLSQFFTNPAILDSVQNGDIFFNINPYFGEVFVFSGAYAFKIKQVENFSIGLNYINYNDFERRDASGNSLGTFSATDYVVTVGKSHALGPIILGANLKLINSTIDVYGSTALLGDVGGVFRVKENWTIGMVFSNIGGGISQYNELNNMSIPLEVNIGTTFRPQFMPFRFTISSSNLAQKNVIENEASGGRSNKKLEQVLRRASFGAELLLSKNFQVLVGYNHKRKQELKLEEIAGGAGFSYGLMLNVKKIQLRYSRATYHAAGGSSFISLQTNFNKFKSIL